MVRTYVTDSSLGVASFAVTTPCTAGEVAKAFNLLPSSTGAQVNPVIEVQLKGAGRTPFSRFADGYAALHTYLILCLRELDWIIRLSIDFWVFLHFGLQPRCPSLLDSRIPGRRVLSLPLPVSYYPSPSAHQPRGCASPTRKSRTCSHRQPTLTILDPHR